MDREQKQTEVDQNYDYFTGILKDIMPDHAGEYAVIRHKEIVKYFQDLEDAAIDAKARFTDGMYSIQKVDDNVIRLGIYSFGKVLTHR